MVIIMRNKKNTVMAIIAILLCSCMLVTSSIYTKAADNNIDNKKNSLLEKGCSEEIVNQLPSDVIDMISSNITEFGPSVAKIDVKKFNVTDADGSSAANASANGIINKTDINMSGYTTNYVDGNNKIIACDMICNFDWLKTPNKLGEDGITVNWDTQYFALDPYILVEFPFTSHIKNTQTDTVEYFSSDIDIDYSVAGGVGWSFPLNKANLALENQMEPGGMFNLVWYPTTDFYPSDYVITMFNITYYHNNTDIPMTFTTSGNNVIAEGTSLDTHSYNIRYMSFD